LGWRQKPHTVLDRGQGGSHGPQLRAEGRADRRLPSATNSGGGVGRPTQSTTTTRQKKREKKREKKENATARKNTLRPLGSALGFRNASPRTRSPRMMFITGPPGGTADEIITTASDRQAGTVVCFHYSHSRRTRINFRDCGCWSETVDSIDEG